MCEPFTIRLAIVAAVVGGAVVAIAPAQADNSSSQRDLDRALAIKDKARVITDGDGRYIAIHVSDSMATSFVFYGSKTVLVQQYIKKVAGVRKRNKNNSKIFSARVWDPRRDATVENDKERWSLTCDSSKEPWSELSGADRKKFLRTAKWKPQPVRHEAYALGRDDFGNYYYVDRIRGTKKGFRLFRGRPGRLKKLRLVDALTDSEGDLFVSKAGSLRLAIDPNDTRKQRNAVEWIERKKGKVARTIVRKVPVFGNLTMIYTKLGVYPDVLGTPCDNF